MRGRLRCLVLVVTLVALAPRGRAQESAARESLARFLTEGALAPFPDRSRERAVAGIESARPIAAGALTFARPGEWVASVESAGTVTFFSRQRPLLYVEGKPAERAAAIARRVHFSVEEDARRARRFLEAHYPDFRERSFELVSHERCDRDSLVEDETVFVERPRPGIAACWPNRIHVSLDPEDGSVSTYIATNERIESSTAPALDVPAARAALLGALGAGLTKENHDFLAARAPTELVAVRDPAGRSRTAWLLAGIFIVDASSGELLARRGR